MGFFEETFAAVGRALDALFMGLFEFAGRVVSSFRPRSYGPSPLVSGVQHLFDRAAHRLGRARTVVNLDFRHRPGRAAAMYGIPFACFLGLTLLIVLRSGGDDAGKSREQDLMKAFADSVARRDMSATPAPARTMRAVSAGKK